MSVFAVVEGDTDVPVVRKLLGEAGLEVSDVYVARGKGEIDKRLKDLNRSAKGSPWFVLRDLDHDAECAPEFLRRLRLLPSRWMVFRVAVREIESWLLADQVALASFIGVPRSRIPERPDDEDDPTRVIVNLARRSRRPSMRRALVPRDGDSVSVGPGYEAEIIEFAQLHWDPIRASQRSPSLHGARAALRVLAKEWSRHVRGLS